MLKIFVISLVLAIAAVVLWPHIASAHVLQIDGDIGAILHIPPDDSPIAGHKTTYVMTFSDNKNLFDLAKCNCKLTVLDGSNIVKSGPMGPGNATTSYTKVTINQPGVYTLRFSGEPRAGTNFQKFSLDYTVRLSDGKLHAQPLPILLWVGLAMAIGLIFLAAAVPEYN